MKNVLMILNYFYPDVASTAQLFTELCEKLQHEFNITVICAVPSYTGLENRCSFNKIINHDRYKNISVIRVGVSKVNKGSKFSRLKYILTYFLSALLAALKEKKFDLVFTISQPPILGGLLGVTIKFIKRTKLVYCIEDFNPEQIEAVGYFKNKLILDILRKIDNVSCKCADKIVVVGYDMQKTLLRRITNFDVSKSVVINNWVNEKEIYPLKKNNDGVQAFLKEHGLMNKFVIMYSGNLGLYYDLENLIKVIGYFKDNKDIAFVFIGEGAKKGFLTTYVKKNKMKNVMFLPYQPKEKLIYSLNSADLHIVTNAKGIKGVSVPSKIYSIMAVGKPILGILEKGSEAQLLIEKSGCGISIEPKKYKGVKKIFEQILSDKTSFLYKGKNGRVYLEDNLSMEDSISRYADVFKGVN